jgi:hypothetical protein
MLPDLELAREVKALGRLIRPAWVVSPRGVALVFDLTGRSGWEWYGDDVRALLSALGPLPVSLVRDGGRVCGLSAKSLLGGDFAGLRWLSAREPGCGLWVCVDL